MPDRDSAILPNDKNKLSDLINETIVALKKALQDNKGNSVITDSIKNMQDGMNILLKQVNEKKGVITPEETNRILDEVDRTRNNLLKKTYINPETNLGFLQLVGIIILSIFIVKLIK
jgi:hypothetical protein